MNKLADTRSALATRLCSLVPELEAAQITVWLEGLFSDEALKALGADDLANLLVQNASFKIIDDPAFSLLAARVLLLQMRERTEASGVRSFQDSVKRGNERGLVSDELLAFARQHSAKIEAALIWENDALFEFLSVKTLMDRYLLLDPETRVPIETPQYFFMRVACGLAHTVDEALVMYGLMSRLEYLPSTPTLFNSGTRHPQMSSCYLLDSPADSLDAIYERLADVAKLSKYAGGVGIAYHRVRSRGSLIRGTNGHSNGIVPWLKTLDASVAAVNQGGKRKGACCVYLETWHADIEEFLELRNNAGDEARRTHNLNISHWIPDLFMRRVEEDAPWSLFDPKDAPELCDVYGEAFESAYLRHESAGRFKKQIKARVLYGRMMSVLAQTGNGWFNFKDPCNRKCNQTLRTKNVVHLSNLCTEILEVTDAQTTAVCNLGSLNLSRHLDANGDFDFDRLGDNVRSALRFLDRVIDINFYPIETARSSNNKWRPVGLGVMGLQDLFFKMGLAFDGVKARALSAEIAEHIYFHALETSAELARESGPHPAFHDTRAAEGVLQFDLWDRKPSATHDWTGLLAKIKQFGLRNSLLIAIAPTATIATIAGCQESIEPQVSNLFKRETLSGEFVQTNKYLVADLKRLGLWTKHMQEEIKLKNGSVAGIARIPAALAEVYRTAWEIPMRSLIDMAADRGAFIDQSQSLNLFMETPTIERMSSMYFYAWKQGLKTTYYLRSRPASEITPSIRRPEPVEVCDLENPEDCEVCQ